MAGTGKTQAPADSGPVIVLVDPQLGENIGTSARAMANCGLADLRLVRPRDNWPNERAVAAASGADAIVDGATVFTETAAAIADCHRVFATTARPRDMIKPVLSPREAARDMRAAAVGGSRIAVLFGPERRGLDNDDVTLAEAVIEVPLNPAFRSLNLAQAVLLVAYEWFLAGHDAPGHALPLGATRPATREEALGFYEHLERELDACGFLNPPEKRPSMVRNIRNIFQRAGLTEQEVRTLRGIVSGLTTYNRRQSDSG